jgi:hypothetical protein
VISFLVFLLLFAIVLYAVYLIIGALSLPDPIRQLALLIVGVIGLIYLLDRFGGAVGIHGLS